MSIWGMMIGGAAGFAVGGPIGAIIGAGAGHLVGRMIKRKTGDQPRRLDHSSKRVAFAVALIALSAKMAKADGQVTRDEVDAFKRIFRIPDSEAGDVGKIFDEARREATGFEAYAEQVVEIFPHNTRVREELLGALFHIAMADGKLHEAEREYLRRVAEIFQFDQRAFDRVFASHGGSPEPDPYAVLGLDPSASEDEIKSTYRQLIRENHPDKLIAEGMPEEMIELANEKMAAINGAYDRIAKQRGIR